MTTPPFKNSNTQEAIADTNTPTHPDEVGQISGRVSIDSSSSNWRYSFRDGSGKTLAIGNQFADRAMVRRGQTSGSSWLSTIVKTSPEKPRTTSSGVQLRSVSASVKPPIFANTQNPLSFIQLPISDPLPTAVAT